MSESSNPRLNCRENQIMVIFYKLGEATAADVEERLPGPPGSLPVSVVLNILTGKGFLTRRRDGALTLYAPVNVPEPEKQPVAVRLRNVIWSVPQALAGIRETGDVSDHEVNEIIRVVGNSAKTCSR